MKFTYFVFALALLAAMTSAEHLRKGPKEAVEDAGQSAKEMGRKLGDNTKDAMRGAKEGITKAGIFGKTLIQKSMISLGMGQKDPLTERCTVQDAKPETCCNYDGEDDVLYQKPKNVESCCSREVGMWVQSSELGADGMFCRNKAAEEKVSKSAKVMSMTLGEMREAVDYYRKQNAMKIAIIKKNYKFNQIDQDTKAGDGKRKEEMLKSKEDEVAAVNSKLGALSKLLIGLVAKDKSAREQFLAAFKTAQEKNTAAMERLTNSQIEQNKQIADCKTKQIALAKCAQENKETQDSIEQLDKDLKAQEVNLAKAQAELTRTSTEKVNLEAASKKEQDQLLEQQKVLEATLVSFKTAKDAVDAKLKKAEAGLEKAEQALQQVKVEKKEAADENAAEKASEFLELKNKRGFVKGFIKKVGGAIRDGAAKVSSAVKEGVAKVKNFLTSDPSCDSGCEAMKKWKASAYYKGTLEEGHTDVTIAAMQDAVLKMKHVLSTQTDRIARLGKIVQHDEVLHKQIMAEIEKDNEALQDDMLQLSTELKILREKQGKAERENTKFEREMSQFMRMSTDKLDKINTETDALLVKDEIIRSGIAASLSTMSQLTQQNEKCKGEKELASVAKAKTLEAIAEGETKEAEAVAKNQLAEDALNQLKETTSVENARLTAANEAVKSEAAELQNAIGNVNDQLEDANTKKKELKGEIMQTMSDTDDIKADTVMVKGEKKKKKMAAFLDDDEDSEIDSLDSPARAGSRR
jgi:DNA repair exonuclease SbcCD ATPase subunit